MYCKSCGKFLTGDENFCSNCGTQIEIAKEEIDTIKQSLHETPKMEWNTKDKFQKHAGEKACETEDRREGIKLTPPTDIQWNVKEFSGSNQKQSQNLPFHWGSVGTHRKTEEKKIEDKVSNQEDSSVDFPKVDYDELFKKLEFPETTNKVNNHKSKSPALAEEKEKIEKFYTFSRKKEEFQKLLDEEYAKLRSKKENREKDQFVPEFVDFHKGPLRENTEEAEKMLESKQKIYRRSTIDDEGSPTDNITEAELLGDSGIAMLERKLDYLKEQAESSLESKATADATGTSDDETSQELELDASTEQQEDLISRDEELNVNEEASDKVISEKELDNEMISEEDPAKEVATEEFNNETVHGEEGMNEENLDLETLKEEEVAVDNEEVTAIGFFAKEDDVKGKSVAVRTEKEEEAERVSEHEQMTSMESTEGRKEATLIQDTEDLSDEENNSSTAIVKEKKRRTLGGFLIFVLWLLIIAILGPLIFRILLPDHPASNYIDDKVIMIMNKLDPPDEENMVTTNESSDNKVDSDKKKVEGRLDTRKIINDATDNNYNNNIEKIVANDSLKFSEEILTKTGIKNSKDIENNFWYEDAAKKEKFYDEEIIKLLISYISQKNEYMKNGKENVFTLISTDSILNDTLKQERNEKKNKEVKNIDELSIGDLQTDGEKKFYLLVQTKEVGIKATYMYTLEPSGDIMVVKNCTKI